MTTDCRDVQGGRESDALREFSERLGYDFRGQDLLREALTHASYANEAGTGRCNERLEYLGDAVLELCVSEALFLRHPEYDEGELTKARAMTVCSSSLASWAAKLRISPLLRISRGLELQGGRSNPSILADAMEAVLGAIFLDGGYEQAASVIRRLESSAEPPSQCGVANKDAKTRLQEALQAMGSHPPTYRLSRRSGPDHASTFVVEAVLSDGSVFATGRGSSIKSAEFAAAESALARLGESS
ncbi:MAG: ribonuclease III [Synergistaceae bacterium]|jgi:ribonuclease-3|nr:ribonuclease III [Synergistaceae bacterium]